MSNLSKEDPELFSVFSVDDDDEDSDEEYYPWSLTGRTLQEVETPYDKAIRIQQANRELFSQPVARRKNPSKVKFDLMPRMIEVNELGEVTTGSGEMLETPVQASRRRNSLRRRQTPMVPTPNTPQHSSAPFGGYPRTNSSLSGPSTSRTSGSTTSRNPSHSQT